MSDNNFIPGGRQNAIDAIELSIRLDVERKYAKRIVGATLWERVRLHFAMAREIKRRLDEQAPRDALY